MNSVKPVRVARFTSSPNAMRPPLNPSNRDPAAIAAAFERADAIVTLEGFVPDDNYRAIQRRVIAGGLTSDQAVQLIIAQVQAADRDLAAAPAKAAWTHWGRIALFSQRCLPGTPASTAHGERRTA